MSHDAAAPQGHGTPRLGRAIGIALALAVAGVAVGLAVRAYDYRQLVDWTDQQKLPSVELVNPSAQAGGHAMTLPGHLEAWTVAPIHARVGGYLKSWEHDIGSRVKAGDTLALIDTPDLDQQLAQAKADLVRAQAGQRLARIGDRRWQNLLASNSVSRQEADEKRGEAEVAAANVLAERANVERLQALESFKRLLAPFDGTVTNRLTDIGDLITANSDSAPALFTIADTSRMRLYVPVPQNYAGSIKPGMQVALTVLEHPGQSYRATLMGSSGSVSQASGSLLAQFEVDNPNGELLPGDYAEVRLPLAGDDRMLALPATALIFRAAGPQVAVLGADGKVALRDIHIGLDLGDTLEIDRGVTANDRVIDHPPDSLVAGDRVRVSTPAQEGSVHDGGAA